MIDNAISEYWYALGKDCPGKTWWEAEGMHPALFRALRIDRNDAGAIYAMHPFRLAKVDERHVILAAWPCPFIFGVPDENWFGIETVLAWDPVKNRATVLGDEQPQIVGAFASPDKGTLFAQPFAFFRAWVEQRAAFATAYQAARAAHFTTPPAERDAPGKLLVGDAGKVRWRGHDLPETLTCVGIDPAQINRAILRQANLPRAVAGQSMARAA